VETPQGWGFIQAAEVTLIGPNRYRCKTLLRGVGSEGHSAFGVSAGARIVYMNNGVGGIDISPELIGETLDVKASAAGRDSRATSLTYTANHLKPLSPVHLSVKDTETGKRLSWIRRSRVDAESWVGEVPVGEAEERYRVRIWNNDTLLEEVEIDNPSYETELDFTHFDVAQGSNIVGWGGVSSS